MGKREAFNAAAAFGVGAECHGWDEWGNITVALTDDCKGLIYLGVPDGDKCFVYPLPDTVSLAFLTFLMGKGDDLTFTCGDFTMRKGTRSLKHPWPMVIIYQE